MDVDEQPTQIVERKPPVRTLQILPPSFDPSNQSQPQREILDGLPYLERFSEMAIANAQKAVHDEMQKFKRDDYLKDDPMPPCPLIDSYEEEIERIYRKDKAFADEIDKRSKCSGPTESEAHRSEVWDREIANCKSQFAHQMNGTLNLECIKRYNAAKWTLHNDSIRDDNAYLEGLVKELQKDIDEVNRNRKTTQMEAKPTLDRLEKEWWTIVRKNNEIELQSQILKTQIDTINEIRARYDLDTDAADDL